MKGKIYLKYLQRKCKDLRPSHLLLATRSQKHKCNRGHACTWLIELSDNKLLNNKLCDNTLASEFVENMSFLNQSQLRKLSFFLIKVVKHWLIQTWGRRLDGHFHAYKLQHIEIKILDHSPTLQLWYRNPNILKVIVCSPGPQYVEDSKQVVGQEGGTLGDWVRSKPAMPTPLLHHVPLHDLRMQDDMLIKYLINELLFLSNVTKETNKEIY